MRRSRRTGLWPRAWRRRPAGAAIAILVALLLGYTRFSARSGPDLERYHNQTFRCTRVIDGDTIELAVPDAGSATTRVRLRGLDTPETSASAGATYFGREAAVFTRSRVEGRQVRLVLAPGETRDRYGRLLAYVYLGDTMFNEELISTGHAYADGRFEHPWRERFQGLEDAARRRAEGLWAGVRPEQMPEWRRRRLQTAGPLGSD